jgi:hypothetical protein
MVLDSRASGRQAGFRGRPGLRTDRHANQRGHLSLMSLALYPSCQMLIVGSEPDRLGRSDRQRLDAPVRVKEVYSPTGPFVGDSPIAGYCVEPCSLAAER